MIENVIKVGGSLSQSPNLSNLMRTIAKTGCRHKVLIVPGGGVFADAVREYDCRFGLDKDASHWMAILAMDQYGCLLSSLVPDSELVQGLAEANKVLAAGRIPVLLSYNLLSRTDELPHSWDVTSDSIAAWVAGRSDARQLTLLKSVDGLFSSDPSVHEEAVLLEEITRKQLIQCGGVDSHLMSVLGEHRMQVWVINGNHPDRLMRLLETGATRGTRLLQPDA